jgi:hypothetical protein
MSEPRKVRCYQYVNRPYAAVRQLLAERGPGVFQRATASASARAGEVGATLHAGVGAVEVAVDVRIQVRAVSEDEGVAGMSPVLRVELGWEASHAAALFPVMKADLSFWPLTATETQLEIEGTYRPPLGIVGNAADAVLGHRIAEASVHRFLDDIVEQIRRELPETK